MRRWQNEEAHGKKLRCSPSIVAEAFVLERTPYGPKLMHVHKGVLASLVLLALLVWVSLEAAERSSPLASFHEGKALSKAPRAEETPLALASSQRSVPTAQQPGEVSNDDAPAPAPSDPPRSKSTIPDAEYHRGALIQAHRNWLQRREQPPQDALRGVDASKDLLLATKCIEIIMFSKNLESYRVDEEGLYRLGDREGFHDFSANGAEFEFRVGEYPIYDRTMQRVERLLNGEEPEAWLPGHDSELDTLYRDALRALGT